MEVALPAISARDFEADACAPLARARSAGPDTHDLFEFGAAQSAKAIFQFDLVRDLRGLDALESAWNELARQRSKPQQGFQAFAWLRAWAKHYVCEGAELAIVCGHWQNRLVLIWPLVMRSTFGVRIVGFMGEPLCQYHDALADEAAIARGVFASALDYLGGALRYDVLSLRRLREDASLSPFLLAGAEIERVEQAPFIDIAGARTHAAFEKSLPGKARASRRRRLRQLEALGKITVASETQPERMRSLVRQALAFKRQWAIQSGRLAPSIFDPRFEACLLEAVEGFDPGAGLRVFSILCDGRVVGVELAYLYKGRLFGHVLAPDPALAKFGIGNALADAAIEDAFKQGIGVYDLLAPADPYKSAWTKNAVAVRDFSLAASWRGKIFRLLVLRLGQRGVKALFKRAPPPLVRSMLRLKGYCAV